MNNKFFMFEECLVCGLNYIDVIVFVGMIFDSE